MPHHHLKLFELPGRFTVCWLDPSAPLPAWLPRQGFASITRNAHELSIVCEEACVPKGVKAQLGWAVLSAQGPFQLLKVGVLASLVGPLALAGISIFVVSTFDTNHVLVAEGHLDRTIAALEAAGHTIQRSQEK